MERKCQGLCTGMPILVNHQLGVQPGVYYWHIIAGFSERGNTVKTYGYWNGKKCWDDPFYWSMDEFYMRILNEGYDWDPNGGVPPIVYYLN